MHAEVRKFLETRPITVDEFDHWAWRGATSGTKHHVNVNGKTRQVGRYLYELVNGPLKPYLYVCRKCPQPHCVNPAHAVIKTKGGYMKMHAKAMSAGQKMRMSAARRARSAVTKEVIDKVLQLSEAGLTKPKIAAAAGISTRTVWRIETGRRRHEVASPFPT